MTITQLVESLYDAFSRGDIPYILSMIAEDATWSQSDMLPWGGEYRGPAGAAEFFTKLNEATENIEFEHRESFESGNDVFSFGSHTFRWRTNGRVGKTEWMFRWTISDGKVVSYKSYVDTAKTLSSLT
jgi:ketosteroid isomerase-like protein